MTGRSQKQPPLPPSPPHPGRQPLEFNFDRPFVFEIVHAASGLELFTGEIYVPEEAGVSA